MGNNTVDTNLLDEYTFELPVGYRDGKGNFHKTVTLTEMTGKVESAMMDKKVRNNMGKMLTTLIEGIVEQVGDMPRVLKQDIRLLSVPDRDYLALKNYQLTTGDDIEWEEECPHCKAINVVRTDLSELEVIYLKEGEAERIKVELPKGIKTPEGFAKTLYFNAPTGIVQETIMETLAEDPTLAMSTTYSMSCAEIEGLKSWTPETFQNLTKKDRTVIRDTLGDIHAGVDLNIECKCHECREEFSGVVPFNRLLMGE